MLKLLYTDCHMMLLQFLIVNDVNSGINTG